MPFPCLAIILLFLGWFSYKRHHVDSKEKENKDAFWNREFDANNTRKQDLSAMPYIRIREEAFPFGTGSSPELAECEALMRDLCQKDILNLTGRSNTELKLQYGAANLNYLSECDQNFTLLAKTLLNWGKALHESGFTQEAVTVLEFGISCRSDVTENYLLLADLYHQTGQDFKTSSLTATASQLNSLSKKRILSRLSESCHGGE